MTQDILPVELYIPNRESTLRPVIGPPSTATEGRFPGVGLCKRC